MLSIGVDAGGTKVLGALVDERGSILENVEVPTDPNRAELSIRDAALAVQKLAPSAKAVGVGAAGFISLDGRVTYAPNVQYGEEDLKTFLGDALGIPAVVENDANAAAWGEWKFGAGRGFTHMIMLTLGTGIGGGIILDGGLFRGVNGMAAELGHVTVDPGAARCACGRMGCLEAVASGTAIGRMAAEHPHAAESAIVGQGEDGTISGADVSRAAESGDRVAREILARAGEYLGVGLANFTNVFDPEIFVIGGGAGESGEMILKPARRMLEQEIRGDRKLPRVESAQMGNEAGVVGAADLARVSIEEE